MRERKREIEKIGVSTPSKASVVYRVYNTAVGIDVHGEQRRGQASIMSPDLMELQRDEVNEEKETEQIPLERLWSWWGQYE